MNHGTHPRHRVYAQVQQLFYALDWPSPIRLLVYLAVLGAAWLIASFVGFSADTTSPYVWAGACYAFAVFIFPFCAYGWIEFLRPRQYWVLPVGALLAFMSGALVKAAELHYPERAHSIFINCVALPFLPYIVLTKWPLMRFAYRALRNKFRA